ncbi:YihY/virulence factor BrkB family protein [Nocardia beijingensis]|uniref:YihY/virulence factor BrkB family protein n=1 Tax=Nocardia beijingensis TaxID=95162 RepID=UPI00189524C3|nr:YihY/virulence factor BrkB family protein [Nocardia beijingensis]MBF6468192.1 YihY/virulence factor BrkB family protein [Nocardia beijingensis]
MTTEHDDGKRHEDQGADSANTRAHAGPPVGPTDTGARPDLDSDEPDSPADLSKSSLLAVVKRAGKEFQRDNLTDLAAALTYYAVLSIVPGLIVLVALLGLLGPNAADELVDQAQRIAPGSSADFVRTLVDQAQANKQGAGWGAILGLAVALWSASGYVAAFMRASNVVYGIGEGRPIWKTTPIRLGVTIVAVILLVVSAAIVVASGPVARQLGDLLGLGATTVTIWNIVKWPVLFVLVSVLLAILFWASPNARQGGIKWISPGGVIAVFIWVVISVLFSVYIANFSSYDKTYGSLAGVVIFLVWLWLTNIALLLGTEINAELDHGRAIAQGLPEELQPFAVPRDIRKLDDADKEAVRAAESARRE